MSASWPEPEGGWKDINDIGDLLTDDEIRELGFEPTRRGWRPLRKLLDDDEIAEIRRRLHKVIDE